jgi:hypothetical protein
VIGIFAQRFDQQRKRLAGFAIVDGFGRKGEQRLGLIRAGLVEAGLPFEFGAICGRCANRNVFGNVGGAQRRALAACEVRPASEASLAKACRSAAYAATKSACRFSIASGLAPCANLTPLPTITKQATAISAAARTGALHAFVER